MPLSSYVVTDDLTVLLGLSAAALFLLQNLYKPQPLVHPILLGRQSDVAPVRNPSESAVYRNYSTSAMGRVSIPIFGSSRLLTTDPPVTTKTYRRCPNSYRPRSSRRRFPSDPVVYQGGPHVCVVILGYSAAGPFLDHQCAASHTS